MEAKEKARDLISRFYNEVNPFHSTTMRAFDRNKRLKRAKKCAIVVVNEIIAERERISGYDTEHSNEEGYVVTPSERNDWWEQVRIELRKVKNA